MIYCEDLQSTVVERSTKLDQKLFKVCPFCGVRLVVGDRFAVHPGIDYMYGKSPFGGIYGSGYPTNRECPLEGKLFAVGIPELFLAKWNTRVNESGQAIEKTPLLSTGDPSTLGSYLKLSAAMYGEDSPAVAFLKAKIAKSSKGADDIVIVNEGQAIKLLHGIHMNGDRGKHAESEE